MRANGLDPGDQRELMLMLSVWICVTLAALVPGRAAYRNSLADGLTLRL